MVLGKDRAAVRGALVKLKSNFQSHRKAEVKERHLLLVQKRVNLPRRREITEKNNLKRTLHILGKRPSGLCEFCQKHIQNKGAWMDWGNYINSKNRLNKCQFHRTQSTNAVKRATVFIYLLHSIHKEIWNKFLWNSCCGRTTSWTLQRRARQKRWNEEDIQSLGL